METQERVIRATQHMLGMSDGDVNIDSTKESLRMDSLDNIEVLIAIEEEFGIEIPDEDAEKFDSIKNIIDCVTGLI